MTPFPVLISIPHGGSNIPEELQNRVCIDKVDLFNDSDAYTIDIYDLGAKVIKVVKTDIARAVVDLNRAADDRPPQNPDGVVKSSTCYERPVYYEGKEPNDSLAEILLKRYYFSYHNKIKTALAQIKFELALDCHSMAAIGPPISPDSGQRRPLVCLGNVHGKTCPKDMINRLANCFRQSFELKEADVKINEPFAGGYITRTYGGNPIPWIQVEMSRTLYLVEPWFERSTLMIKKERLHRLNKMFENVLIDFFCA